MGEALRRLWPYTAEWFADDEVDTQRRNSARPGLEHAALGLASPGRAGVRRPQAHAARGHAVPLRRQSAACTANTWASCSPRCRRCRAPSRGRCGEPPGGVAARPDRDRMRAPTCAFKPPQHGPAQRAPCRSPKNWRGTPCPACSTPKCRCCRCSNWASCASIKVTARGVHVVVTPTYSGCPATEVIQDDIRNALFNAGASGVQHRTAVRTGLDDRLDQRRRRREAAPLRHRAAARRWLRHRRRAGDPGLALSPARSALPALRQHERREHLSAFGSTACKALYRCLDCREPFEYFKPI